MATPAQIDANRLNSQLSSGPRTLAGKAASSANSFKHGLYSASVVIPGEDPLEYERHAAEYLDRFRPGTPDESFHVETMIEESWKRRRYSRIEAALMQKIMTDAGPCDNPLAATFSAANPDSRMLDRIIRARAASTRAWNRAYDRLQQLAHDGAQPTAEVRATERTQIAAPPPPPPAAKPPERTQSPVPFLQRNIADEITPAMSKQERERILAWRL
jgi:hypothetical protein